MEKPQELVRTETSTGRKLLYAFPRLGTSIVLGIESWALLTLYTSGFELDSILTGFALAMGYLTIALAQFAFGWLSDMKYTKMGRRKPYLLIFAPLLALSSIFLLLPDLFLDLNDKFSLFLWLLIWDIVFRASYACTTPYQAWMAELFKIEDRPKTSQYQNTFNFIGNGLMSLFTLLILTNYVRVLETVREAPAVPPYVYPSAPLLYLLPIIIFGILVFALFYLLTFRMPTEPYYKIETKLMESLKVTLRNRNFMKVVLMIGISGFGWTMISTGMLKYAQEALHLGFTDYIIVAVSLLLSIFIFLYIWRKLIERKGKKPSLLYVFLLAIIFMPITLLALIPMSDYLILGIIYILGIGAILGGWFLFPYIVYADIAEDDEKSTGDLKAGIYAGFPSIILNIFQAIAVFLNGLLFALPSITNGIGDPFTLGLVIFGPITSIILLVSYLYTKKYVTLDFKWEGDSQKLKA
ncbi:MAG: MFS transporter [Candidatus Hermodarchaeota archaeon]